MLISVKSFEDDSGYIHNAVVNVAEANHKLGGTMINCGAYLVID